MTDLTAMMARDARLTRALKRFLTAIDVEMDDSPAKDAAFGSAREAVVLAMRHPVRNPREVRQIAYDSESAEALSSQEP